MQLCKLMLVIFMFERCITKDYLIKSQQQIFKSNIKFILHLYSVFVLNREI